MLCEKFLTFLRNNSHSRLFFAKSFSRLPLFCKTIPFLCEIFLTGFPMSSNTIHMVGISVRNRRDAFVLATGNAVTTHAAGAASAAAAVSAADDVVHGTEDVEQGEPNKKESSSTHHWKKRKNMKVEKKGMRAKQM